ncbi:hypothetical protein NC653_001405 [Populus alba x Populus x berolinensis]|uniref:Uncharacterized protein n=1 Tax=Populus alba x Populus x berolinensis TaxID=444605 RepID=A0AAD6RM21_9ROSI|nr:hypothetical protein NC653_001405 [Populus alba x Populus x berolinensis]
MAHVSTWKYGNMTWRNWWMQYERVMGARGSWHSFMAMQRIVVWFRKKTETSFSGLFRCPLLHGSLFLLYLFLNLALEGIRSGL